MSKGLAYLACPYSHSDEKVRGFRHQMVTQAACELIKQGIFVYSPLTHNIPICQCGLAGSWEIWQEFDLTLLSKCDRLIVLQLPGWKESVGVAAEMASAAKLGLPIEFMEVESLLGVS